MCVYIFASYFIAKPQLFWLVPARRTVSVTDPKRRIFSSFFTTECTPGLGDLYLIFCLLAKKKKRNPMKLTFFVVFFPTSVPNMYLSHLFNVLVAHEFR